MLDDGDREIYQTVGFLVFHFLMHFIVFLLINSILDKTLFISIINYLSNPMFLTALTGLVLRRLLAILGRKNPSTSSTSFQE